MFLFVGLGNPGPEYKITRHNIGFLALDALTEDYTFSPWREKFKGHVSEGFIAGEKALLLKPQTYMNLSGQSVSAAMQFYKIPLEKVIVIHDDLDLSPGRLRMKQGGGHGGHNGLRDIDQKVGKNYWRMRLGIGHPRTHNSLNENSDTARPNTGSASNYVLGRFSNDDLKWLGPLTEALSYHLPLVTEGETEKFVSKVMQDMADQKLVKE